MTEHQDVFTEKELKNIEKEFIRLKGEHYLDHAGSGLYAESQISEIFKELSQNLYSNPHTSKHVGDCIEQIRYRILKHFNTDSNEYSVVFTSGATAALKLAVECFDFKKSKNLIKQENGTCNKNQTDAENSSVQNIGKANNNTDVFEQVTTLDNDDTNCSKFVNNKFNINSNISNQNVQPFSGTFAYLQDCHTSALGLREVAASTKNAKNKCVSREDFLKKDNFEYFKTIGSEDNNLFVYPAQCNFSGYKYPLDLHLPPNWYILLDAASYAANSLLDLTKTKPNFIAISFYKIFGYPTGLGALLVRKDSADLLGDKRYFGGGTVEIALSGCRFHKTRKDISERLEDGTVSFLSILSLRHGFDVLERLVPPTRNCQTMLRISEYTFGLARYAYQELSRLCHLNFKPAVKIYKDTDYEDVEKQGGVVNFNLLGSDGSYIGFAEVEHMANLYNIQLRTGCFCNPGACQRHLQLTDDELRKHHLAGHVCGDENDLIDGIPTGSVRISFGYYSTKRDVDALIQMIKTCYIDTCFKNNKLDSGLNKGLNKTRDIASELIERPAKCIDASPKSLDIEKLHIEENVQRQNMLINLLSHGASLLTYTKNFIKTPKPKLNEVDCNPSQIVVKKYMNQEEDITLSNSQMETITNVTNKYLNTSGNNFDGETTTKMYPTQTNNDVQNISITNSSDKSTSQLNLDISINQQKSTSLHFYEPIITKNVASSRPRLQVICVYPVKSCRAYKVTDSWPVGPKGLLYDREWMVVSLSGAALTQKHDPGLCKIRPRVDLKRGVLVLSFSGLEDVAVPLAESKTNIFASTTLCNNPSGSTSRVCGDAVGASDCGDEIALWLESALGRQGVRLVRQCEKRSKANDKQISLVNRAQYLLINSTSVQWLLDRSRSQNLTNDFLDDLENYLDRFRANLIVSAPSPLEENNWKCLETEGGFKLKVDGPCSRCQIICIDQKTGQKSPEPLRVISNEFHGKRTFGVYLSTENNVSNGQYGIIRCGEIITQTDGID